MNARAEGLILHNRLISGDPTASAEIADTYLPRLFRKLRGAFQRLRDETYIQDAAIDAVMDYIQHPAKYDPEKSSLITYLFMSARGDLLNALDKSKRISIRTVALDSDSRNIVDRTISPASGLIQDVEWKTMKQKAYKIIKDPNDRRLVDLIAEGERTTASYVEILGLNTLGSKEQRQIVKRHKDRLNKLLQRHGIKFK